MSRKEEWYWSDSESDGYNGPYASRAEAIKAGMEEGDEDCDVWVGTNDPVQINVDAQDLLDRLVEAAYDEAPEDALGNWCDTVTRDKKKSLGKHLTAVLKKHLVEWGEPTEWISIQGAHRIAREL